MKGQRWSIYWLRNCIPLLILAVEVCSHIDHLYKSIPQLNRFFFSFINQPFQANISIYRKLYKPFARSWNIQQSINQDLIRELVDEVKVSDGCLWGLLTGWFIACWLGDDLWPLWHNVLFTQSAQWQSTDIK